jgi:rhamnogalacturonan endolyase
MKILVDENIPNLTVSTRPSKSSTMHRVRHAIREYLTRLSANLAPAVALSVLVPTLALSGPSSPVAITEDDSTYTLDNGIIRAQAAKRSGDLTSIKYHGVEMLNVGNHQAGYWSHNILRGQRSVAITIDPRTNQGERGEVSFKGHYDGTPLGSGPGGSVAADIEIRYALGRGDSGLYTWSVFDHKTNYPATSVGEARFCIKLNDALFDWMTVDANRNMKMLTAYDWNHGTVMNFKEARRMNTGLYRGQVEHKYDYAANQFDVRAWGWSSTTNHVGLWFINASVEYLSGGPTKVELSAHRDATFGDDPDAPAPPTLLNYWRGSHYGGSVCSIAQTDAWTKVIGPFLIYCNTGPNPNAMWKDALAKADRETAAWPYDWVSGVDYPHRAERGTVTGRLVLHDPQAPKLKPAHLLVGLTAPDYTPARAFRGPGGFGGRGGFGSAGGPTNSVSGDVRGTNFNSTGTNFGFPGRFGRFGLFGPRPVDWQNDAKNYEFWVQGDASGNFTVPNIRPGTYTLHAIADGVLGEFSLSNVTVTAGQTLKLGQLNWQPVRYGSQLWEIGIPNRSGAEFFKGNDYFHWGWYLQYPKLFPNDVHYVIGRSDFHKDWFFEQVPHNEDPANTTGAGQGRSTPWTISFRLPRAPQGMATLRLALCAGDTRRLDVAVNGQPAGAVTNLIPNATIMRDGIAGYWCERDVDFDASLMKAEDNTLTLTVPAGSLTTGVIYDYLRLELKE